ncbi:hypothetical protein GHT06_001867 [Daphnia sinensis]|uniref:Uncharacterized protein n=1 Tax=Daphnia sinensis TaxID=1820382 RepID=A0AAD5PKN2_9CRUS|nr:hypothetical protein GHT06_001867 [Daphnia sinensis]
MAAKLEDFNFVGIELSEEYYQIAGKRISAVTREMFDNDDIGYEAMYSGVWMNPTSYGGVRLTEFGDMMLRAMNATHHDFVLPFPAGQFIHLIARTSKIYDDEIATMIGLYGTLNEYLDSLENNN